jgi:hypothetical protein
MPPQKSNLLEESISGPRTNRHLIHSLLYIHKADTLINLLELGAYNCWSIKLFRRKYQFSHPRDNWARCIQSAIIALNVAINFLRLKPATGLQSVEGLGSNLGLKARPTTSCYPRVNEIELALKVPWVCSVIFGYRRLQVSLCSAILHKKANSRTG